MTNPANQKYIDKIVELNADLKDPNTPIWNYNKIKEIVDFYFTLPDDSDHLKFLFWTKVCSTKTSDSDDLKYDKPIFTKKVDKVTRSIRFFVKDKEVSELEFYERRCKNNEPIDHLDCRPKRKTQWCIAEKIGFDLEKYFEKYQSLSIKDIPNFNCCE